MRDGSAVEWRRGRRDKGADLVGVVLGGGKRYFGDYAGSPLLLENPQVVQGDG